MDYSIELLKKEFQFKKFIHRGSGSVYFVDDVNNNVLKTGEILVCYRKVGSILMPNLTMEINQFKAIHYAQN
jgi:hypothetical protein